jgi:hypothetical protein
MRISVLNITDATITAPHLASSMGSQCRKGVCLRRDHENEGASGCCFCTIQSPVLRTLVEELQRQREDTAATSRYLERHQVGNRFDVEEGLCTLVHGFMGILATGIGKNFWQECDARVAEV